MKQGRIQCPNCNNDLQIDHISDKDDTVFSCPTCQHQFNIHPSCKTPVKRNSSKEECSWEEHGEPRKTILSSMKPRTDRPMIATLLLLIVVCIGIIASITPGLFLETPVMVFSAVGTTSSVSLQITDFNASVIDLIEFSPSQMDEKFTGVITNDTIYLSDLPLGSLPGSLTIMETTNETIIPIDLYVIPVLSNSYDLSLSSDDGFMITHQGYGWCTAILFILSVICLIGMFSVWQRSYSDVALIGSFVGIFTIGFFFLGTILSGIAFYLIYQSRDEFDDGKKGKSF